LQTQKTVAHEFWQPLLSVAVFDWRHNNNDKPETKNFNTKSGKKHGRSQAKQLHFVAQA